MSSTTHRLRGQTRFHHHVDDAAWFDTSTTQTFIVTHVVSETSTETVYGNNPYGGPTQVLPMGWRERLTPEQKGEKKKKIKQQEVKDVKRLVMGPKGSRWK